VRFEGSPKGARKADEKNHCRVRRENWTASIIKRAGEQGSGKEGEKGLAALSRKKVALFRGVGEERGKSTMDRQEEGRLVDNARAAGGHAGG